MDLDVAGCRVAVIGLGSMGVGLATPLKRARFKLVGCDVNAAAVQRFRNTMGKATTRPSPASMPDSWLRACWTPDLSAEKRP